MQARGAVAYCQARAGPAPTSRDELNAELLAHKKQPLARTRVVGKLAKGVIVKRDLRLLKN